ncbi:MAG: hypothetical protein LBS68_03585, partial [Puniceicoccales bacterium]|nr:hypothetical protein [Puniceicoccales bacterium]
DISEIAASQERFHSILGPKELLIKFVLNESACRQLCKEQLRVLPEGEAGIELIKKIDKEKLLEKMQLWVESDAASGLSDEYLEAIFAILTDGKDVECNELPKSLLKLFPSDKEHSKKLIEKLKEHTSAKKVSFAFSEWAMEQSPDDEGFWADIQIQRVLRGELGVDIILGSSKIKSFLLKSESTRNGILTFLFGDKGCGDATMYSLLNLLLMDSNLASASHENLESIFAKLNYGYDYAKTVVRWAIGSEENAEKFISKDVIAGYISYVPIEFEDAMFKYLTSEDRMENFEPYYIDKIIANSTVLQDYISDKQLRSLAMASRQSSSRYKSSLENLSDKRLHAIKLSDENEALLRAFPSEKLSLNQILFLDKKQSSNSGDGSNLPTQLTISTGCVLQLKNELTDYLTSSIGGAKTGQATNVDSPKAARGEVGSIPADGISKKVNEEVTGQNVVEDVGQKIKLLQEAAKNPSTREEASSVLNELHKMSADSAPNRLKWLTISAGILSALSCGAAIALGFLGFLSTAWVVILPAIGGLLLLTLGLGIAYAVKRKQFQNSSLGKLGGLIG